MKIDACGATHIGNIRAHNEDNLYVDGVFRRNVRQNDLLIRGQHRPGEHVYAVFDGLGGEACGEHASLIAAMGLKGLTQRGAVSGIDGFISAANSSIKEEAVRRNIRTMGTTAVILTIAEYRAKVCNIGDSRAYLFSGGELRQLSRDHTMLQSLMDNGFEAEAGRHREKYARELTQYLGMTSEDDVEPSAYETEAELSRGDIMLLCSDGLTAELSDGEIRDILASGADRSAEYLTGKLIKSAVDKTGFDNITAVVCKVD